jgi:hypothetical protein
MSTPIQILEQALARASENLDQHLVANSETRGRVEYVCRCLRNRAGVRLLCTAC